MLTKLKVAFAFIIFLIGLEFIAYFLLSQKYPHLNRDNVFNLTYNALITPKALVYKCSWPQTIKAHPQLGFIQKSKNELSEDCRSSTNVNNVGIQSDRDFPNSKKSDEYSLLVVGGSVAQQFSEYRRNGEERYFEKMLNQSLIPPKGKKFVVYTGAMGAWGQPQQGKIVELFGKKFDAVISLEGHNEAFGLQTHLPFAGIEENLKKFSLQSSQSLMNQSLTFIIQLQRMLSDSHLKKSYFLVTNILAFQKMYHLFFLTKSSPPQHSRFEISKDKKNDLLNSIKNFHLMAQKLEIKSMTFLHPTRFMGKALTLNEKNYLDNVSAHSYLEAYRIYLQLKKEGWAIGDLTNVFQSHTEDLFGDHIHLKIDEEGHSKGNELVTEAIIKELHMAWKMPLK